MMQHIFGLSLIIEGATDKKSQIVMLINPIGNLNLSSNEQKCIFEHCIKVKKVQIYFK